MVAEFVIRDPRYSFTKTVVIPPAIFTAIHPAYHLYIAIAFTFSVATLRFTLMFVRNDLGLIHTI
jgi:hypothetical protein